MMNQIQIGQGELEQEYMMAQTCLMIQEPDKLQWVNICLVTEGYAPVLEIVIYEMTLSNMFGQDEGEEVKEGN
jgi:hypothetical protein